MPFQEAVPAPPAPPAPQGGPLPVRVTIDGKTITSPNEVYSGLVQQRKVLGNQMEELQEDRSEIARRLSGQGEEHAMDAADRAGLQKRLTSIDQRIEALDAQIAGADAQVASAAAVPGAVVEPPPYRREGPPEEFFVLGGIFMFVAILPMSIAYSRRIWRRGATVVSAVPRDITERFSQLDQAVESIAVEVERIGEGQRFITRVLSEQGGRAALGEGAARPIDVRAREGAHVPEPRRSQGG